MLLSSVAMHAAAKPKKPLMKDGKQVAVARPSKHGATRKPAVAHGRTHTTARSPAHSSAHAHHAAGGKTTMPASHDRLIPVPAARPLALPATAPTGETYAPSPNATVPEDTTAVPPPTFDAAETAPPPVTATPFASIARGRSALHFPAALQSFFAALQAHEAQPTDTVRIMQWGDSHTAADMLSGEARAQMQARFGDGGVGYTYAGHPFAGYRILGSGRGQSTGWQTLGTHFTQLGDALLGLGGVAIEAARAGDSVTLDAPCRTLDVQYLARGGGGSFQLADNGAAVQAISTEVSTLPTSGQESADSDVSATAGSDRAGTFRYFCPQASTGATTGPHHFTLTTLENAPMRLLGTVALQAGVTWEAMGINGAEAPLMLKWNQPLFGAYLSAAAPQLIVLAYGTNEAAARYEQATYEAVFSRLIDILHRNAPRASILVLGPGDRSLGSTSYTLAGRGRHKVRVAHHSYTPYIVTARIVAAQRAVCEAHGCAFWDWQARQGGLGSMQRWVASGLGQPDHTHFTAAGYRTLADALVADLLSAYDGYLKSAR